MSELYTCNKHTDDYDFCPICELSAKEARIAEANANFDGIKNVLHDTQRRVTELEAELQAIRAQPEHECPSCRCFNHDSGNEDPPVIKEGEKIRALRSPA